MNVKHSKRTSWIFFIVCLIIHFLFITSLILGYVWDHPQGNKASVKAGKTGDFHQYGFLNSLFNDAAPYMFGQGADFFITLSAGRHFLEGKGMYGIMLHRTVPYAYIPYPYPPSIGIAVGVIFSVCTAWQAYWCWVLFYELLLLVQLYCVWRVVRSRFGEFFPYLAGMWLAYFPYYVELYMGQINYLMTFFIHLFFIFALERKQLGIALSWIGGYLVKIVPVLFLPALLKFRYWKTAVAIVTLLTLSVTLAYVYAARMVPVPAPSILSMFGVKTVSIPDSLHAIVTHIGPVGPKPLSGSPSLSTLLQCLGTDGIVHHLIRISFVLVAVVIVFWRSSNCALASGLLLSSYLLGYVRPWEHHYVLALPLLSLLVYSGRTRLRWVLGTWLLLALPTPYFFYGTRIITDWLYYLPKAMGALLLFILFLQANVKPRCET